MGLERIVLLPLLLPLLPPLLVPLLAAGCREAKQGVEVVVVAGGDGGAEAAPAGTPLYALMTQVYVPPDARNVYVTLSNTLDLAGLSLPTSREFGGVANLAAVGGRLLVSDGEQPKITAFDIGPDLSWREGPSVSFTSYPLEDNANFYYQFILDDHTAYLPVEATKRILWDPTAMEIKGVLEDGSLPLERDGLRLEAGGNRAGLRYPGAVLQAFFYHDADWFDYGSLSHVVAYDPVTHRESKVIDVPCPGLSIATRDEAGHTYFGSWGYAPTRALYGVGAAPCVARVKPDLTLDTTFTSDLRPLTGGRFASNFRYVGGGKALANVLHHELLGADFTRPYDPAVAERIDRTGSHWRLWMFDVQGGAAHPVEGIDAEVGSGAQFAVLDGRTFVFLPIDDWTNTRVYELDAAGRATFRFQTAGDVFKWIRVR